MLLTAKIISPSVGVLVSNWSYDYGPHEYRHAASTIRYSSSPPAASKQNPLFRLQTTSFCRIEKELTLVLLKMGYLT